MADLKSLKLRAGICKRLLKELKSYEKEVEKDAARVEEMKASGADSHDIKQQENVLAESRMMVPDCRKRLETAYYDLESTVVSGIVRLSVQGYQNADVPNGLQVPPALIDSVKCARLLFPFPT
ncbi:unnamed protein product [Closterium sp. Naga37s-1]|nr:unnamed protein product [Closterium sp. Naga37s-1]